MKNYYYFLGIPEDATEDEIKKAYRKLSVKYHPDKNENDSFFAARFMETQEAYEILTDQEKRRVYDENLSQHQRSFKVNLPPAIRNFSANKIRAEKGEEIIIKWQTNNADLVKVIPFGLEKAFGERVFKITEFKNGEFQLLLHATNTLLNKTVVRGITIKEILATDKEQYRNEAEELFRAKKPKVRKSVAKPKFLKIILAVLFLVIALMLLLKTFEH